MPWRGNNARNFKANMFVMPRQPPVGHDNRSQPATCIEWTDSKHWTCPGPDGKPTKYTIEELPDRVLWQTITWAIDLRDSLFVQYIRPEHRAPTSIAVQSEHWLGRQPAFLGLLYEAIRREFTFSEQTVEFVERVLRMGKLQTAQPWERHMDGKTLAHLTEEIEDSKHKRDAASRSTRNIRRVQWDDNPEDIQR